MASAAPPPAFYTLYLDGHDLEGPSMASGETLNNFPEKRKRLNLSRIIKGGPSPTYALQV